MSEYNDQAKTATGAAPATKDDIKELRNLFLSSFDVLSSFQEELKTLNSSIRSLKQKVHDLESDSRTDRALLRAAQKMGFGFHEKTPYELQGNAAIEDIKEYY